MYILILNRERVGKGAGRQDTEGEIGAERRSGGRKSTWGKSDDGGEGEQTQPRESEAGSHSERQTAGMVSVNRGVPSGVGTRYGETAHRVSSTGA